MKTKRILIGLALVSLAVGLVIGFYGILERRFQEGDIYPHYASFRSDPLGTSAFYETLDRMEAYEVSRNVTFLNGIEGLDENTTLLLLGYPRNDFGNIRAPEDSPVLAAVEKGARLVITINPELVTEAYDPAKTEEEEDWLDRRRELREKRMREKRGDDGEISDEEIEEESEEEKEFEERMNEALGPRLTEKLGFDFAETESYEERPEEGWETDPGETVSAETVPAVLPYWRSPSRFETESADWKDVVLVEDAPVVIERKYGEGTVVFTTDSYFVSNEALHLGAETEFLLWLLGGKRKIVFDETTHGTRETGGAMKLVRQYRLHGFFFGLFVFVALWAWRSASSLAPGSEDLDRGIVGGGGMVAGEQTDSGFIRLLRRSVSKSDLIQQCLTTWKSTNVSPVSGAQAKRMEEIAGAHRHDPKKLGIVEAYRAIAASMRKR